MPETSLYPAVKRFLEAAGFQVKGEVRGCDVVAVHNAEPLRLAIVEMKLGFSLELLLQATDRMRVADEVWLAVPATRRGRDRDPRVHRLCRLMGFGLMAVNAARDRVEVLAEPAPIGPPGSSPRGGCSANMRGAMAIRLRAARTSAGDDRVRQQALACAALLRTGPGRPLDLRTVAPEAGRMLFDNVYGWFERTQRGVYRLTDVGEAALQRWPDASVIHASNALALPDTLAFSQGEVSAA